MKRYLPFAALLLFFAYINTTARDNPIIIDHTCCDLSVVPEADIITAKSSFRISYGHTSHGSQIVSGMNRTEANYGDLFAYQTVSNMLQDVPDGHLWIYDRYPAGDLGNPDRTTWADRTRDMLYLDNCTVNTVMWSWCGQVNGSEDNINTYLTLMNGLEEEFPYITFIYMTGHLDGSGEDGNVNVRNNQIREFCKENNKILFDFADIESYDPDGNYFLDRGADDGCNYDDGNWAVEWCEAHPGECDDCSCAHSHCLNCQQKGRAFWWMMARLAGWEGITSVSDDTKSGLSVYPSPANDYVTIELSENITSGKIEIFDVSGNRYSIEPKLEGNKIVISTLDLTPGFYSFRLYSGLEVKSGKFVISR